MKDKVASLSRRYQSVLRQYVTGGRGASLRLSRGVGAQALAAGLHALDLARIHEKALATLDLSGSRNGVLQRARDFFAEAIAPIEETHRSAREAQKRLDQVNQVLNRRTSELAVSNLRLKEEIAQRRGIERSLRKSERHYGDLLEQSGRLQNQLRRLSHQILSAQEEERKKISRELHDVIAQTLTGINVQLAKLKTEASRNKQSLEKNIFDTQRLVEKSVSIVHRFARELRPTVLDDLGLIPALHTFMKRFTEQTGIRVSLTAFAAVEHLNGAKRTVLYRVTQEALTNVARHAQASRAEVRIEKQNGQASLTIQDNGRGFQVRRVLEAKKNKRLGLLGMRERIEMVGGKLTVQSAPGQGTTIEGRIPLGKNNRGHSAR